MKIGIADTMFAQFDMGELAVKTISLNAPELQIERYTVPGVKDLAVASKKLIEELKCDIVLAFGMVGKQPLDEQCAHEANLGLIQAELMTNKHIIKVFVHQQETDDPNKLIEIFKDRTSKHTLNAIELLKGPTTLQPKAGQGKRQGGEDAGPL
jgi:riboflavin synthase|tara:strand:- start:1901 stop:2359 length:459 start_codon:yes stop_codon:yes gene_type:complete